MAVGGGNTNEQLEHRFAHHPPRNEQTAQAHESVRSLLQATAILIRDATPTGREQSLALTKLEEAMFWANAAIARNP
jgi:hypothetical protein